MNDQQSYLKPEGRAYTVDELKNMSSYSLEQLFDTTFDPALKEAIKQVYDYRMWLANDY